MTVNIKVRVIGGGLAGCEAAVQLARRGFNVELYEMKTISRTPAQVSDRLAELVCSNSFRSNNPENAVGLLKAELRLGASALLECAEKAKVPAGDALAVDRDVFSTAVETMIAENERITRIDEEVIDLDNDIPTIIATGPLTSESLAEHIISICGKDRLAFYDAIAPIVEADSIDMEHAFFKSRYEKGDGQDYLNCPMDEEQYATFYKAVIEADQAFEKEFEKLKYFEGCLPMEVMASRGERTLTFGPFKPVGLRHPVTEEKYKAVLQLRKENLHGTAYNLVGCQTRLKQGDQKKVFSLIPALKNVVFLRYGAIHRNTFIDSPSLINASMQLEKNKNIYFAGQITGVEGYVESIASGYLTAHLCADVLLGLQSKRPPDVTALGGLYRHVLGELLLDAKSKYSPSNINWSMIPAIEGLTLAIRKNKKEKRRLLSERALNESKIWFKESQWLES